MNRITQCLHGKGTVSAVMKHRQENGPVPSRYLAFTGVRRPVVFWNLTDRCNLACSHCYSRSGPECVYGDELTTAEARAFIDDLAVAKVPLVIFTGGEPLVRPDIWDLAGYCRQNGIKTALSTNGTLITDRVAEKIKTSGIEYAGISLDGAIGDTHDRFRNTTGAFEKAVAAFACCRRAGVRSGVRVTLTRDNQEELGALVDLARDLGVSRFCLYWLVPCGRGAIPTNGCSWVLRMSSVLSRSCTVKQKRSRQRRWSSLPWMRRRTVSTCCSPWNATVRRTSRMPATSLSRSTGGAVPGTGWPMSIPEGTYIPASSPVRLRSLWATSVTGPFPRSGTIVTIRCSPGSAQNLRKSAENAGRAPISGSAAAGAGSGHTRRPGSFRGRSLLFCEIVPIISQSVGLNRFSCKWAELSKYVVNSS